jgi:hypothetical protein
LENQRCLLEADEQIRRAYDRLPTREAIKAIAEIWEQLDRTAELAAARSRILVGKLSPPRLAPTPKWFEEAKEELRRAEDGVAANPAASKSAELLIRAALARIGEDRQLSAEVEIGPMGRISIDWYIPHLRLHWLVDAIDIPWPTVKVYQVSIDKAGRERKTPRSRIFYNAFDAIDSFADLVAYK